MNPVYSLYAVNKTTNAMTKVGEGAASTMRALMNRLRHSNGKETRYALYQGNVFMGATNN